MLDRRMGPRNAEKTSAKSSSTLSKSRSYFQGSSPLDSVDFRAYRGKVNVLVGENGAGVYDEDSRVSSNQLRAGCC